MDLSGIPVLSIVTFLPLAGAVLNDIGPDINPRGLAAIAAYMSTPLTFDDWQQAVSHLQRTRFIFNACKC